MPVHDWTRVEAGIFQAFHVAWIPRIQTSLNDGLLPELSPDAIVEMPHSMERPGSYVPLPPAPRPQIIEGMLAAQDAYEILAVEGALDGGREARLRGLLANPMVSSYDQAVSLLDAIEAGPKG